MRSSSTMLGKSIAYGNDNLDEWESLSRQFMPAGTAFDLRWLFELFQERGFSGIESDIERQTRLLSHPPRSFRDFAKEAAATWNA